MPPTPVAPATVVNVVLGRCSASVPARMPRAFAIGPACSWWQAGASGGGDTRACELELAREHDLRHVYVLSMPRSAPHHRCHGREPKNIKQKMF